MSNLATLPSADSQQLQDFGSQGLLLDFNKIRAMQDLAEAMSAAAIAVPAHFRGKPGDCLAVVMQAVQWGMNPFAVAQKTHVVNGALGYEAQLVNAVVQASGAISGRFNYEYRGEGANVECRVGAVINGERDITWGEWLSAATVTTKNSPLWKTNPKQQLGYLQVKNWARAYTPGAILGVYSVDELDTLPAERNMGAIEVVQPVAANRTDAVKAKLKAEKPAAAVKLADVTRTIDGARGREDLDAAAELAAKLDDPEEKAAARRLYVARLAELKRAAAPVDQTTGQVLDPQDEALKAVEQGTTGNAPTMSFAEVEEALIKATTRDAFDEACDLIQYVAILQQREELGGIVKKRLAEFKAAQ